jgi:ribosomal protein S20
MLKTLTKNVEKEIVSNNAEGASVALKKAASTRPLHLKQSDHQDFK